MSRLEGSRWRLRWAREMRLAMEFEWVFFRLLFGSKRIDARPLLQELCEPTQQTFRFLQFTFPQH